MDIDVLVEMFTGASWIMYTLLILIGLPGMYNSVWQFIMDDDITIAIFAFVLPVFFCAGLGLAVYFFPLFSGAVMSYFIYNTLNK